MTLQVIQNINLVSLLDSSISLTMAFICGSVIGFERQFRQRTAGLRTNVLVAVGAAIFVDMGNRLTGNEGAVHIVAYVVSGIGFLGAGVIMREEGNVRGLNTAATLWGSAAVGACAGADLILEAVLGTIFVLATNTVLRPIVNGINRKPIDTMRVEATNTFYVIALKANQKDALALLESTLEAGNFPVQQLQMHVFGADSIEIEATLLANSVETDSLNQVVDTLLASPFISQAFWSPNIKE
ncbi:MULTISPECIES: MgtC/SapB family protein [unclassified Methylophilus]|uniref:MgtC/SapB family protein n=1 Tax=unclassified Methylophilus TaxID=2630143 RepID=UPI00035FBD70|nr:MULTISPECIES: MgtC/SapB family protein [unclassified Methylophilus]MBF4991883.1 MgtC/SapB family protein [Methylophilus sp. QUAN]